MANGNLDPNESLTFQLIDSVTVKMTAGPAIKIGISDISITILPPDISLNFDVALIDGDGDQAGTAFDVRIDGDNDGQISAPTTYLTLVGPQEKLAPVGETTQAVVLADDWLF